LENNALISLKTVQDINGDNDVIELKTFGKFGEKNGKFYIIYEESELTGFAGSTTTIKIDTETVTMTRRGSVNSKMVFKNGEKQLCTYDTPYGRMVVAVEPKDLQCDMNKEGGNLKIEYILDIDNTPFSTNLLNLNVEMTNN